VVLWAHSSPIFGRSKHAGAALEGRATSNLAKLSGETFKSLKAQELLYLANLDHMKIQAKDYWKLFKPSSCALKLKGTTTEEVFAEITLNLVRSKSLREDQVPAAMKALMDREAIASTGVGMHVAIPHVKLEGLEKPIFSASVHPTGLDWKALDGEPAHLIFVVLRPERAGGVFDPDSHLQVMKWLALLNREPDFRRFARAAATRTELVELLREMPGL